MDNHTGTPTPRTREKLQLAATRFEPQHNCQSLGRFCTLVMLAAVMVVFAGIAQALPDDESRPPQVNTGTLVVSTPQGARPVPLLSTTVDIRVSGMISRVQVTQVFENSGTEFLEGLYLFPLPDEAAVDTLQMRIGDRIIVGEIQEKEQARQTYARARAGGQRTSLVEQRRANLFSSRVANVAPGEQVQIEIGYLQTLQYNQGEFSLRFPMTVTPRFEPPVLASATMPQPKATAGAVWQRCESPSDDCHYADLTLQLDAGFALARVESLYHEMEVTRSGSRYRLIPADGPVLMDRDFELVWQPALGAAPEAAVFTETWQGETFAMILLLPPEQAEPARIQPREVVFVIDTSGSMGGTSIQQARDALLFALEQLQPQDRFNIVRFASTAESMFREAMPTDPGYLLHARRYVQGLTADGGTNIAAALDVALDTQADARARVGGYLRQVVFITDGSVGNEARLFGKIEKQLGESRLFTVGIGSAPNDWFMRKAAQFGRGTFTHIGADHMIEERMEKLFARLQSPQLQDIEITGPAGAEVYPQRVPDLYRGEPVLVRARLGTTSGTFNVTARAGQARWQRTLALSADRNHAGVAALWGRGRIEALLDTLVTGADEIQVRPQVIELALRHHLVSRYTSLVAVDRTPVRAPAQPLQSRPVALNTPHGSVMQGYPAGATPTAILGLSGLLALLLALAVAYHRRIRRSWQLLIRSVVTPGPYWDWQ